MSGDNRLIIATTLRERGITGVHTHFLQLIRYLQDRGDSIELVTPFSWGGPLINPVFGSRFLLEPFSGSAGVWWHRQWHEVFLYRALRRRLAAVDDCVIYAQCPPAARAALRARQGRHQRVVLAVHFRISQADEWADKGKIARGGGFFRAIRSLERAVVPAVDGMVYVSKWGQDSLVGWLPEASSVPSAVIPNFVVPQVVRPRPAQIGDLVSVANLDTVKNHRYLLRTLVAAKANGRVYTLDIYGEGPLRKELERDAESLGVRQQVRLQGFQPDVRDRLPGYRAYVHASYSESLPLAIIEAMAAGLPIVAGAAGGVAELLDDGVEGRLWPLDDPVRAAQLLIGLVDDEATRAAAAQAAAARFRRDFDVQVVGPRLRSFLMNVRPGDPSEARGA
jgi:glycosyltransferase involved in cell wall biosynthesis